MKNSKKKVFEYIKGPKFYEIKKKVKNQINRQFLVDFKIFEESLLLFNIFPKLIKIES